MLTVEKFKERLEQPNRSDWLHVVVDANNANQFYIVGNGGMGNTISMPIEKFPPEINACVISMRNSGELIVDKKPSLLLDINTFVQYLFLAPTNKESSLKNH